ncbi:flagellar basal body rod protein FlgC [Luteithermobacter gelatinilyticus]|uniref:flagellar basal body rod protein FlgC n=1 Tax=Luteithermobacter gelatinilyticus TaxID=2582913 RepID=UPI001106AA2F|nr:flagellar basal body rod C-terminal domain-containing protein [Luteithermobacter gelatinilyticus]
MLNAIKTSLSGLLASSTRMTIAASNIVNARTTSTPEGDETFSAGLRGSKAYLPQKTVQTTNRFGGVKAHPVPVSPAHLAVYDPTSPVAGPKGYVNTPNVNEFVELSEMIRATSAYETNAKVLAELDNTLHKFLKDF